MALAKPQEMRDYAKAPVVEYERSVHISHPIPKYNWTLWCIFGAIFYVLISHI
jgi:hypothetical protein